MFVVMATTPAQTFHLLRRHMLQKMRRPLIVMTPKSLLRSPLATSTLDELSQGSFQPVIAETDHDIKADKVNTVILCSGKVYYDLVTKRREEKIIDTAIIRIEQLYPFPDQEVAQILKHYSHAKTITWVQEEPKNQGSWYIVQEDIRALLTSQQQLVYAGRAVMASPAVGYGSVHTEQQKQLVSDALSLKKRI